jgi:hypothetical protein
MIRQSFLFGHHKSKNYIIKNDSYEKKKQTFVVSICLAACG